MFRSLLRLIVGALGDLRLYVFMVPALLVLSADMPVLVTLGYSLAAIGVIVALSHLGRRFLLPYIDLDSFVSEASRSPIGSAIVFLGVMILVSTMIISCAMFISR